MEIKRGIIELDNSNTLKVSSIGAIYNLPKFTVPVTNYKINEKVNGIVTDDVFNVIFQFKMKDGLINYGYYTSTNIDNKIKIQKILNYNPSAFDAFKSNYELDEEMELDMNQIKEINLN